MESSANSGGLTLAQCVLHLERAKHVGEYPCRVSFDLNRTDELIIEPQVPVARELLSLGGADSFLVSGAHISEPVECFLNSTSHDDKGDLWIKLVPKRSPIFVDHSRGLIRVTAGVINLGHYLHRKGFTVRQFSLKDDQWVVDFTPAVEPVLVYPPKIQTKEYCFTHQLELRKTDGSLFSAAEARDQLSLLCRFLSFCHGYWVSTALTCGIAADGTVAMEEWGLRQVSPWHRGMNWLDEHTGDCMVELYPLFIARTRDQEWRETIEQAIYWNHRSESTFVGPDGGCVLVQTILERLAWQLLVIDKKSLSEDGFARLPAADQLRLMLSASSIPLEIPSSLAELRKLAKDLNWCDGPQAFVAVRNRIVHPPKKGGQQGRTWPFYEAYLLGKWYVDLAILSTCGYMGRHANRTRIHRWVGEVEPVPWAS